jgi:hypothetical protein
MAYTINLTNGTLFAVVADGTINTTSSMTLVGQNYAGYGAFLDTNFVHLLESGANTTQPSAPLTGQLWWDSTNNLLKVYNGATFKTICSSTAQNSAPTGNNVTGDLWYDTANAQLNVWTGSAWLIVGPGTTTPGGTTGAISAAILDSIGNTHYVVELYSAGSIVGIVSKDATFTPATPIPGFESGGIRPGIQLATAVGSQVPLFQGTATNAQNLNSLTSNAFMRTDANTSTSGSLGVVNNTGLTVGANSSFKVSVSGIDVNLANQTTDGNINFKVNIGGTPTTAMSINGMTGVISGLQIDANYADLAERFEADAELAPGTVVELGGSAEITQVTTDLSENVFGVISTRAAYMMNSSAGTNATHPPVAMTGRVPVRTIGQVRKGDRLVSAGNGLARAAQLGEATAFNVIGRALKDKLDSSEGTVEAIVTIN